MLLVTGSNDDANFVLENKQTLKRHAKTELLNLTTWEWQDAAKFPGGWYHSGAALYFDGVFYVTGGVHEKFPNFGNIQKYVIETKKWIALKTGVNPDAAKAQKSVNLRLKTPRYKQSMILIGKKLGIINTFWCIFETFITYIDPFYQMIVVGGENSNAAKNPAQAEYCELDESQPFRECKFIKESKLDKQIRPKLRFNLSYI